MQLTNGEIFNAKEPLGKLLQERLPVKTAFALAKLAKELSDRVVAIETVKEGLIQTYGEPDPDNLNKVSVAPAMKGYSKFMEELGVLFSQEVEVVVTQVVLPAMIAGTCDGCGHNMEKALEVEAVTLMLLDKFVTVA